MKFGCCSIIKVGLVCSSIILSACVKEGMDDLKEYVKTVEAIPKTDLEPLPKSKVIEPFYFTLDGSRDPFVPIKKDEVVVDEQETEETVNNGIQPDFDRRPEDLEGYPLDALKMVGTIRRDMLWALIHSEEGIQRVRVGNYMGKNHGKIIEISETEIHLEEIMPDEKPKTWFEKSTVISLSQSE